MEQLIGKDDKMTTLKELYKKREELEERVSLNADVPEEQKAGVSSTNDSSDNAKIKGGLNRTSESSN
ncbi:hypothetical protein [Bacillus thuringiensis]|uniref:hypothetical protein n=1 Tax=Bacillus thuringiensis TaxID=1428 RepID=UPI0013C2E7F2|nr:hypothetical protein [Bacillus thuringiensis]